MRGRLGEIGIETATTAEQGPTITFFAMPDELGMHAKKVPFIRHDIS
jgi:hypothetical protein